MHDLQHRCHQLRLCSQQQAQRDRQPNWQRPHPLAHRHMRDDVVDQVGGGLRHAPRAAGGAEPSALAAESHQLVVTAVTAAQAQEAVRQDAALDALERKGVELVLDEGRQAGARGGLHVGEEGLGVLLDQPVQRGLLGPVALVVDRGTISSRGTRCNRPLWRLPQGAHFMVTTAPRCAVRSNLHRGEAGQRRDGGQVRRSAAMRRGARGGIWRSRP